MPLWTTVKVTQKEESRSQLKFMGPGKNENDLSEEGVKVSGKL